MSDRKSILNEIKNAEDCIQAFYFKIETIENNLKQNYLDNEERQKLEDELEDIRIFLSKSEKDLKILRKENRKSFAFSAILIFIVFLLYGTYIMIFGNSNK
ncbi:coiled-coil domain-containing protein 167-like [Lycorma delicatula]|uniref:coiled-coil domain-containing protein 167-like n=1 Tax=Lycorma delicatula TaxID=130591 RepID=UPI003F5160A0